MDTNETITIMNKQLSILVPVYNVEKYIRPFFESVFRQGLSEECYEIIVVNDGTPDRSMEQVADLLALHNNVTVINQENQGLSIARNVALARATGEYVLMLDSDDLLVNKCLPILLEKALESKVDILQTSTIIMNDTDIDLYYFPHAKDIGWKEVDAEYLLESESTKVWDKLFRTDFCRSNHIEFHPRICAQDIPFSYECYLRAKKCLVTNAPMTIYRKHPYQISATFSMELAMQRAIARGKAWDLHRQIQLTNSLKRKLYLECCKITRYKIRDEFQHHTKLSERMRIIGFYFAFFPDFIRNNYCHPKTFRLLHSLSPRLAIFYWILHWLWLQHKMAIRETEI